MQQIDGFLEEARQGAPGFGFGALLLAPVTPARGRRGIEIQTTQLEGDDGSGRLVHGADVTHVAPLAPADGREVLKLGRGPKNDVVVPHASVSRVHALLLVRGGGLQVADAGSVFGTYVAGKRVATNKPVPIASGERLRVGEVEFLYLDAARFAAYCRARASIGRYR
jgi:hypothetical protein